MGKHTSGDGRYHWRSIFDRAVLRLGAAFVGMLGIAIVLIVFAGNSWFMALSGWLLTGIIGLFLLFVLAQRVSAPNPVIVIDELGIHDKRLTREPVPWSAYGTLFARNSGNTTVFAYLRNSRRHLVRKRRGLLLLPFLGLAGDELPLILSPVDADPDEVLQRCEDARHRDIESRVLLVQEALSGLSALPDDQKTLGRFLDAARDSLFHFPMIQGMREDETFYPPDETGGRRLDLFSDPTRLGTEYPDKISGALFLADMVPEIAERGVDEITFDRGAPRSFTLDAQKFLALAARL